MAATATAFAAPYAKDQLPGEFDQRTFGPFGATASGIQLATAAGTHHLMIFDRDVDIESITVRNATITSDTTPPTVKFVVAPSGTAIGSGTDITAAESLRQFTNDTAFQLPLVRNRNIAGGSVLAMVVAGTVTAWANFIVDVRYKTHSHRTDDAGNKQFVFAKT